MSSTLSSEVVQRLVEQFKASVEKPKASVGIAVIKIFTRAINESQATTFMGVDQELSQLMDAIQKACPTLPIHFRGAAQVFRAGMSKASESKNADWKHVFVDHANKCLSDAKQVLSLIPAVASEFLQQGMVILTRGYDRMVASVLEVAAAAGHKFHLVITEGRPKDDGIMLASVLNHPNVEVTIIPDSAVGLWMNSVNVVLVGTDLVLEDGGLVATVGTYSLCVMASVHRKPVYCVCETFKFMRKFVVEANDLAQFQRNVPYKPADAREGELGGEAFEFDFTPAKYVSLLLTEKGPMPPSAVTHELTKLLGV
jgi:translation initiation factor eIF-2B subunit alpha